MLAMLHNQVYIIQEHSLVEGNPINVFFIDLRTLMCDKSSSNEAQYLRQCYSTLHVRLPSGCLTPRQAIHGSLPSTVPF
jgi:hypothetical protein